MKSSIVSEILKALQSQVTTNEDCYCSEYGDDGDCSCESLMYDDFTDLEEDEEDDETFASTYKYKNPQTNELFFFERTGLHKKGGPQLQYMGRARIMTRRA